MEIQEKHRLEILNAKCEYVCAVDTLVKKMNYGEDVDCCINKLYLAQKLIGRLECFCFETPITVTTEIKSQFSYSALKSVNLLNGDIFQYLVNGKMIWSYSLTSTMPLYEVIDLFITDLNIPTEITDNGTSYDYIGSFDCNVTGIKNYLTRDGSTSITTITNTVPGACATSNPPCYNCITTSDLPKMYEVLHKLLS